MCNWIFSGERIPRWKGRSKQFEREMSSTWTNTVVTRPSGIGLLVLFEHAEHTSATLDGLPSPDEIGDRCQNASSFEARRRSWPSRQVLRNLLRDDGMDLPAELFIEWRYYESQWTLTQHSCHSFLSFNDQRFLLAYTRKGKKNRNSLPTP